MNPNPDLSNLQPFEKGQSGNPNGRPRKYVSQLKEIGYKKSEINDAIQAMMAMNMEELKEVWENKNATILEKTVANAMRKSMEKGTLYSLETLLSRVFGQPKQEIDTTFQEKPIFGGIKLNATIHDSTGQDSPITEKD
jgi:hypothetical protein